MPFYWIQLGISNNEAMVWGSVHLSVGLSVFATTS